MNAKLVFEDERNAVASVVRRLYRQMLTTTSGGNVSLKLDEGHVIISGSGYDKAELEASHVCVIDSTGQNQTPHIKPTIETDMHLRVYEMRPDVTAIVHAHPTAASTFCACERQIDTTLIAEAYAIVGTPVKADYALMGTLDLATQVATAAMQTNCVLMKNHGVLTVGRSLLEAFDRLEVLEKTAEMTFRTRMLSSVSPLTHVQLDELDIFLDRSVKES